MAFKTRFATIIIITFALLLGCQLYPEADPIPEDIDYTSYSHENEYIGAITFTADHLEYEEVGEERQTVEQIYHDGFADCERYSELAVYLINRDFNVRAEVVEGTYNGVLHEWIEVEGQEYEPQTGYPIDSSENDSYRRM